jgi:tRNA(fMet)-specific endonuclease VapC
LPVQFLLDSNIVSDLARNPQGVSAARIARVGEDAIATSIIVVAELRFGLSKLEARSPGSRLSRNVRTILSEIQILPFDAPADEHYGEIRRQLESAGTPIGPNDLLIAAHARSLGLTVVTDNEREFVRVPQLRVENWLQAPE